MNNRFNLYEKEIRSKILANPQEFFNDASSEWMSDVEFVVKKNSKDTTYFVLPSYNAELDDNALNSLSAAKTGCAGSAGSATTAATAGSVCTTLSTASTLSSVATAGTAK